MGKRYMLSSDTFATKKSAIGCDRRNAVVSKEVHLFAGTILEEVEDSSSRSSAMVLRSLDHHDSMLVLLSESQLTELNLFQVEILLPVTPVQERWTVLKDRQQLREASVIMEGSAVTVDVEGERIPGVVRYCGTVPEMGKGILFGVELLQQTGRDEGTSADGVVKGKHYFSTKSASSSAEFVPINKLRLQTHPFNYQESTKTGSGCDANNKLQPIPYEKALAEGASPPPISLNDTVVWISDQTGPEYGVVRWLGKLPDVGNDWMVGVDFVNPVGSGTGKYNDHQLFETKFSHASLVPIIGLMKAEDFLGEIKHNQASSTTPAKPNRKKKSIELLENSFATEKGHQQPAYSSLPRDIQKKDQGSCWSASHSRSLSASEQEMNKKDSFFHAADSSVNPLYELNNRLGAGSSSSLKREVGTTRCDEAKGSSGRELEIGSVVEVLVNGEPCYGVIRWIGTIPEDSAKLVAGIEMEEENVGCTDGTFNGRRYFTCQSKKGFFVRMSQCRKDGRFTESEKRKSLVFGSIDCNPVSGHVPPLMGPEAMNRMCGKNRGIQGHHNSCYLDATLFAMFSCTAVFDSLLHRPMSSQDIREYNEVQRVLKEEIVNPLRTSAYVRADRVMRLRALLHDLSSISGLMTEEKDPEEFLNLLLNQILKAEPFLKLSSGQESYLYQLFVEKDEKLSLPTVQQLFDQSFLSSDIKLREIPPCLLVQMPRFGKQFKMYPRIVPSLYLDITDVLDDSPRQCSVCGQVAEFECKDCFGQFGLDTSWTQFCQKCMEKSHGHKKRQKHKSSKLSVPQEFVQLKEHIATIPRVYMELFAILCIQTSHYVAFVKCGSGPDAPWSFFDSMADRKGEQNGYNIPEVVPFQDLRWWLSEEGANFLGATRDDKVLPDIARRLLCDAYICLYQSPDIAMYR